MNRFYKPITVLFLTLTFLYWDLIRDLSKALYPFENFRILQIDYTSFDVPTYLFPKHSDSSTANLFDLIKSNFDFSNNKNEEIRKLVKKISPIRRAIQDIQNNYGLNIPPFATRIIIENGLMNIVRQSFKGQHFFDEYLSLLDMELLKETITEPPTIRKIKI